MLNGALNIVSRFFSDTDNVLKQLIYVNKTVFYKKGEEEEEEKLTYFVKAAASCHLFLTFFITFEFK